MIFIKKIKSSILVLKRPNFKSKIQHKILNKSIHDFLTQATTINNDLNFFFQRNEILTFESFSKKESHVILIKYL